MKIAHLIITYTDPLQTERMIRSMQHPDFDFYIHVDKKLDIRPHLYLMQIPGVYFIHDRVNVVWAGYNTVKATIRSVKEIFNSGRSYDYIHLMSGQDYPIKAPAYIHNFFVQHYGHEFLQLEHFDKWPTESYPRIRQYHLTNYKFPGKYYIQWLLNRLLPTRVSPVSMEYYGNSMFWALTPACLQYVIDFIEENKKFRRFINLTWGADEFLFQTIIMNSPFRGKVLNNNLLFLERDKSAAHPNILTLDHLTALFNSDKLFARKFSMATDAAVLDKLDSHLSRQLEYTSTKKIMFGAH